MAEKPRRDTGGLRRVAIVIAATILVAALAGIVLPGKFGVQPDLSALALCEMAAFPAPFLE